MVAQLAATATVGRLATTPWQVVEHIKGDTAELDSVVVRSPLPGGVAAVVRFLFNLPQWFQIWGFVAGVLVAIVVVVLLWRVRQRIVSWFLRRSRAVLVGLGAVGALVLSGVAVFSDVSWNYTQHNNNFCVACHIMTDAYQRFGTSAHQSLQCHDCHQQSLYASMMQVYYWVAERPASIPPTPRSLRQSARAATSRGTRARRGSTSSPLPGIACICAPTTRVSRTSSA